MIPDINDPSAKAMLEVLMEVGDERFAQEAKWGRQDHPWGGDEQRFGPLAEYAREECEEAATKGEVTWRHILKEEVCEAFACGSIRLARKELIQVAAVAVSAIEAIDRQLASYSEEGEAELRYGGGELN